MTAQPIRSYAWPAIAIIVAAVIVAATIFVAMGDAITVTKTVSEPTISSSSGTGGCTFTAEGFLLMRVVNSTNGQPVGSLGVQVQALQPACASSPAVRETLGTIDANASGFLSVSGPYDWAYFAASVGPRSYSVNASMSAGALTCVTLTLPSGNLDITQSCNEADYFGHGTGSTSTQSNATSSVSGANGLTFRLTMNFSTSSSGVTVSALAADYNLRAFPTNVTAAYAWSVPTQVLQSHYCTPTDNAVGVSIAQGHYTLSNVSSAHFLIFINPAVTYTCTEQAPVPVASYAFSPMSDTAMASGSCGGTACGYNTTVYDQLQTGSSYVHGALSGFAPGEYTVVAGDEWGNSLLAYFTVP